MKSRTHDANRGLRDWRQISVDVSAAAEHDTHSKSRLHNAVQQSIVPVLTAIGVVLGDARVAHRRGWIAGHNQTLDARHTRKHSFAVLQQLFTSFGSEAMTEGEESE